MNKYTFKKYQPLSLRIWHWMNALTILGLLATVLLRKTFLSWRTNSALIEAKLQEAGISISADLAKNIAVSLRDPMWNWHYNLGFVLVGLLVFRIILGVMSIAPCPGIESIKLALKFSTVPPSDKFKASHYILVKIGYGIFYLCVFMMGVTGLVMYFKSEMGINKEISERLKEFHETMMWFFVIFASGHLLGVVVAENRQDAGLISDMINGGNK